MNTIDRDFLIKHGFQEDADKKELLKLFEGNQRLKEANISVTLTEPAMLLARSREKNVVALVNSVQDKRLILKKSGRCSTIIMNVLLDEICGCLVKDYGSGLLEFEFEVYNLRYSLNVSV
ncbi:MAG: hypothetical protein NC393_14955 [Clostridium sp.]|nr:hypothetical protein [Clostridium sp.]